MGARIMKLTAKQELFAREIAKGTNQYQSFCIAYPLQGKNSKRETLDIEASRLANSPKITLRLEELRKPIKKKFEKTVLDLLQEIEDLKKEKKADTKVKLDCCKEQGKMLGYYVARTENVDVKLTDAEAESKLRDYADKLGITWEEYCARMGIVR